MRRRVGISARNRHSRLRNAFFGADNVDNALFPGIRAKEAHAKITRVLFDMGKHVFGNGVGKRALARLCRRRNDVIDGRKGTFRILHLETLFAKHRESLRTGHFVAEMKPDEQLILAARKLRDDMAVKHFLV